MSINIPIFFLLVTFLAFFLNCTTDYFSFSNLDRGSSVQESYDDPLTPMAYCNKFNKNGFNGILTAYHDANQDTFKENKARLYLWNIPDEFSYPPTNYIQVHAFSISNNKSSFNSTPVSLTITKDSNAEESTIVTTLSHDLLEDLEGISIEDLIKTHSFILNDVNGWHGITLSVFNVRNQPLKTAKVLIPPFPANPHTYLNTNNKEQLLFKLHPFEKLSYNNNTDQVFYEKGLDFCEESPVEFEVPPFTQSDSPVDPYEQLLEDLSFLPDF